MPTLDSAYTPEIVRGIRGYLGENLGPVEMFPGEFAFFIKHARAGRVLELASGAGRILMPLATAGIEVFGLEASSAMLALCREAVGKLPEYTRRRIHLIQGDMCQFAFTKSFPLIIVPFNSFWFNFRRMSHVSGGASPDDYAMLCLRTILEALDCGGTFIIDTPIYYDDLNRRRSVEWWLKMAELLFFSFEFTDCSGKPVDPESADDSFCCRSLVGRKL